MASRRAIKNAEKLAGKEEFDDTPRVRSKKAQAAEEDTDSKQFEQNGDFSEESIRKALKSTSDEVSSNGKTKSKQDKASSPSSEVLHGYYDDPNDSTLTVKLPSNLVKALDLLLADTKEKRLANGIRTGGKRTTYIRRLLTKELVEHGYYVERDFVLENR